MILVTTDESILEKVQKEIKQQLAVLPRKEIAEKAIANSKMIAAASDELAIDFINQYGPEHYIICMEKEELYVNAIQNAGSVFVGNYTQKVQEITLRNESYLITNGYAKQYSGVNLDSFKANDLPENFRRRHSKYWARHRSHGPGRGFTSP